MPRAISQETKAFYIRLTFTTVKMDSQALASWAASLSPQEYCWCIGKGARTKKDHCHVFLITNEKLLRNKIRDLGFKAHGQVRVKEAEDEHVNAKIVSYAIKHGQWGCVGVDESTIAEGRVLAETHVEEKKITVYDELDMLIKPITESAEWKPRPHSDEYHDLSPYLADQYLRRKRVQLICTAVTTFYADRRSMVTTNMMEGYVNSFAIRYVPGYRDLVSDRIMHRLFSDK